MAVPIAPAGAVTAAFGTEAAAPAPRGTAMPGPSGGFSALLAEGLQDVDRKVVHADAMIQAFAQGETIPVHQVTLALEEARLAVELAVQVRTRLVETYRDFMNMQL